MCSVPAVPFSASPRSSTSGPRSSRSGWGGGVVDSTFQGPVLWRGHSLTTIVDKGLLHFDWILVD